MAAGCLKPGNIKIGMVKFKMNFTDPTPHSSVVVSIPQPDQQLPWESGTFRCLQHISNDREMTRFDTMHRKPSTSFQTFKSHPISNKKLDSLSVGELQTSLEAVSARFCTQRPVS